MKERILGGISRRTMLMGMTAAGATMALGRPAAAQAQGDLVFWSQFAGSKGPAGEALENAFTAAHPDVNLVSTLYAEPAQLNEKILTSLSGNTAPDLFVQHWDYNLTYADGGKLIDLGEAMKNTSLDAYDPSLLAYGQINGGQYSVPMYGTSRAIGMNRKLLEDAGLDPDSPPTSWDELTEWAIAATQRHSSGMLQVAGFSPYQSELGAFETFAVFLTGAGGRLLSEDMTEAAFNSEAGLAAMQYLHDLHNVHKVTDVGYGYGQGGMSSVFNSGRCAMIIAGNYSTNNALKGGVDFDVAPVPKKDGDGFTSLVDPFAYGVPSGAKNPDAAVAFVEFALSLEQQVQFAVTSKNVPLLLEAQQHPDVQADPYLFKFVAAAKYAPKEAPAVPAFSRLVTILSRSVQEAVFGRQTPEQALESAYKQISEVIART